VINISLTFELLLYGLSSSKYFLYTNRSSSTRFDKHCVTFALVRRETQLSKQMSFNRLQLLFIISFAVFYMLFHQSYQLQLPTDFPPLDSSRFHNSYFSITRNKKQRPGKIKSVQVYDDMACIQQCSQMTDGCVAVNFKKQPTNGLHECELLASDLKDQSYALENDEQFDHILLVQVKK